MAATLRGGGTGRGAQRSRRREGVPPFCTPAPGKHPLGSGATRMYPFTVPPLSEPSRRPFMRSRALGQRDVTKSKAPLCRQPKRRRRAGQGKVGQGRAEGSRSSHRVCLGGRDQRHIKTLVGGHGDLPAGYQIPERFHRLHQGAWAGTSGISGRWPWAAAAGRNQNALPLHNVGLALSASQLPRCGLRCSGRPRASSPQARR